MQAAEDSIDKLAGLTVIWIWIHEYGDGNAFYDSNEGKNDAWIVMHSNCIVIIVMRVRMMLAAKPLNGCRPLSRRD